MEKLISVISVTYNADKTLERMICSVINQSFFSNIEFIIIDGKSTDKTVNIIKKYDEFIDYWISENDSGIYDAMNKGLNVAKGKYVYFLGADDWLYSKDSLENVARYLDGKYDVVSGKVYFFNEKLGIKKLVGKAFSEKEVLTGRMAPHQGMFTKRVTALRYKFNVNNKIISDYEMFLRIFLSKGKIIYINNIIANFSITGISSNLNKSKNEYIAVLTKYVSNEAVVLFTKDRKENYIKKLLKNTLKRIVILLNLEKKMRIMMGWQIAESNVWMNRFIK